MAPHLLENTRNRLGNGRPDAELDPGITMSFLSWRPGLAANQRLQRAIMDENGGGADASARTAIFVAGDSKMAPHLLENTRNRVGNGRPRGSR